MVITQSILAKIIQHCKVKIFCITSNPYRIDGQPNIKHFTVEQGVSLFITFFLLRDSLNFLWLGSLQIAAHCHHQADDTFLIFPTSHLIIYWFDITLMILDTQKSSRYYSDQVGVTIKIRLSEVFSTFSSVKVYKRKKIVFC